MKKYEILEHIADLKIKVIGRTKEELFKNAMFAMEQCLRPKIIEKTVSTKIRIESESFETLLVDFLDEINYQNETNMEIYNKIIFGKLSDNLIEAELFGKKVVRFGLQIKGATFHNLDVRQKRDSTWEATILFDI